jgi:hypothetical protein
MSETDAAEAKRRAEWLHKHNAHKDWVILSVSEISIIKDELLVLKREREEAITRRMETIMQCELYEQERDEARADLEFRRELYKVLEGANSHLMTVTEEAVKLARALKEERDEAREQNKTLREALLSVRTWGINSKNWSATHGDAMSQWIDDGCAGELPPPHGQWIYEKLEGAK